MSARALLPIACLAWILWDYTGVVRENGEASSWWTVVDAFSDEARCRDAQRTKVLSYHREAAIIKAATKDPALVVTATEEGLVWTNTAGKASRLSRVMCLPDTVDPRK